MKPTLHIHPKAYAAICDPRNRFPSIIRSLTPRQFITRLHKLGLTITPIEQTHDCMCDGCTTLRRTYANTLNTDRPTD